MNLMRRDNPALPDSYYMNNFISGLHDSIQHLIQCHEPQTLQKANWSVRRLEQTQPPRRQASPNQPLPVRRQVQFVRNRPHNITPSAVIEQARLKGVCYKCNEKWFPGHRKVCKMTQQAQVQALQAQVPEDAEIIYYTDFEEELEEIATELPDQKLQISMHALMGFSVKKYTFNVKVNINNYTALALIDSGSMIRPFCIMLLY
ncbi:hypothetical protein ACQJBY_042894 [Aegilops geniculata]